MDVNTSFTDPIPVSPPFKREVQYISFKHDFDNVVDIDADVELLDLRLQHEVLIHNTLHITTTTSTPPPSLPPPQVIPNKPTIRAADHLLTLIHQFPAAPPFQPPPLSPFNFSYINLTNPIPSNDPSTEPSLNPSARPSAAPTFVPRSQPLSVPSTTPRTTLVSVPRFDPSLKPSQVPNDIPSSGLSSGSSPIKVPSTNQSSGRGPRYAPLALS